MNPLRSILDWIDATFFARPWPERREAAPSELDVERVERIAKNRRIARLREEATRLKLRIAKARRQKKARSQMEKALQENLSAQLGLEAER